MRKILLSLNAVWVSFLFFTNVARASTVFTDSSPTAGRFAAGVVVGEPSGLSAKYWLHDRQAIDMGLAYSFSDFLLIFADYKIHFPQLFDRSQLRGNGLYPYAGLGTVLAFHTGGTGNGNFSGDNNSGFGMGLRIPLGLEWMFKGAPLALFVEVVPGIGIVPSTFGFVEGGLGLRYYF